MNSMSYLNRIKNFFRNITSWGTLLFLILLLIQVNYLLLYRSSVWNKWISYFKKDKPRILQVVHGSLVGNQINVKVIKKQFKNNIYLEFLSELPDHSFYLINSIQLKGKYESYFEYWDKTVSLALLDEDGDGQLDVVAPATDGSFNPYINLISYSKETKKFELKPISALPRFK